jgi:hypothetical protein
MYLNNIYLFGQVRHESVWLCRINYSCVDDVSELCMAAEQDRDLKGDGRGLPTPVEAIEHRRQRICYAAATTMAVA